MSAESSARLPAPTIEDFSRHMDLGPSLVAVTRSADNRAEITRCGAARVTPNGTVIVAMPMPESERTLANLEATGVIALTAARPTTYQTLQMKGTFARRIDWPGLELATDAHRARFFAEVVAVGLMPEIGIAMWSKRFVAVEITVHEVFDQTPGANINPMHRIAPGKADARGVKR